MEALPRQQALSDDPPGTSEHAVRVLVVDDNRTNLQVLRALLQRQGYEVLSAENGREAVETFQREKFDLVLMDVMMPVMDGYEATERIKSISGEHFVPVIFVTALTDEASLVRCIEAGGDDFLSKPYNQTILRAKIDALMRLQALYDQQRKQKEALAYHQKRIEEEQRVAERLFSSIAHSGCLDLANIRYSISPMAIFNGDLLLASKTPSGSLHVMLGDFTGHGLVASIGALPASEIFYGMTAKGFGIGDIVAEINNKLSTILPTGLFLAACVLELNFGLRSLTVWSGGVPDLLVFNADVGLKRRLGSRHVPMGILDAERFDRSVALLEVEETDQVFLYTDGVIEAENPEGEFFRQERLESYFVKGRDPHTLLHDVLAGLDGFQEGCAQADDITMIQLECKPAALREEKVADGVYHASKPPTAWQMGFEMQADLLRAVDPLPVLVHVLMEVQGLYEHRERLYMLLTELFVNALEHGLLRLDSAMKNSAEGFREYYSIRKERLAELGNGAIRVELSHAPLREGGGRLIVELTDTGPGFIVKDAPNSAPALDENTGHAGRGIPLVRSFCQELVYNERGNSVRAVYEWK